MDFNATIDLIIKELKEASDIIDDLKKYPGVPVLQVELARLKCKSAGEVISILKEIKGSTSASREAGPERDKPEPKIKILEEKTPVPPEYIPPAPQLKKPKVVTSEIEIQPAVKPEPHQNNEKKENVSSILADQFVQPGSSLIEQLSPEKTEEEIADILKTKVITTLNEAIGINDRFLYIREIFNGDQNEYNKALVRLESVSNLADAKAILMSYTGDSSENETVKILLDLIKRKLHTDE